MKQKGLRILLIIFIWYGGAAWGVIIQPSVTGNPSVIPLSLSCYDILTYRLQDCGVALTLSEGTYTGGHAAGHEAGRPLGGLRFYGETGTGNPTLSFRTNYREVGIQYIAPEVSGSIGLAVSITPIPPRHCVSGCQQHPIILAWIERLSKLPEGLNLPYMVIRGGADTHPEGTYGTQNTLNRLQVIAREYFKLTDRTLSINDLSLTWGGLFDINNDWGAPHQTHRFGTDADINQTDGGGVLTSCPDDDMLRRSIDHVNEVFPGGKAALKCETGGRKHVDFY